MCVRVCACLPQNGTVNIDSLFTITDQASFDTMAATMFTSDTLEWDVDGHIDVSIVLAGIRLSVDGVPFRKSLSLPGALTLRVDV